MQESHYQEMHPPPLRFLHKFFFPSFFPSDLTERDRAGRSCPPAGPRGREWVREGLAFQRRCRKVSGMESPSPAATEASRCARASRHPPLWSGEGYPKHANVCFSPPLPVPCGDRQPADRSADSQLPELGLGMHECLRELLVPFLDVPGQSC